jgi:hypothetical protein
MYLSYQVLELLTWLPTSRKMVTDMMPESQMILEAICISKKVVIWTYDRESIDVIIQYLLQSDSAGVLLEAEMVKIKSLSVRFTGMWERDFEIIGSLISFISCVTAVLLFPQRCQN